MYQALLQHGANPDLETSEGWSIVQECVASGNLSLAQVFLLFKVFNCLMYMIVVLAVTELL